MSIDNRNINQIAKAANTYGWVDENTVADMKAEHEKVLKTVKEYLTNYLKSCSAEHDDPKENAAFERCVDVMTDLILKYGPVLNRRWTCEKLLANVWLDIAFDCVGVKRLSGYHSLSMTDRRLSEKGNST